MDQATGQPYVLYQSVDISFNFEEESILGHTTIWLGFRDTITPGTVLNLHCRQCNIKEVLMNGVQCDYVHNDPLVDLSFDDRIAESYIGRAFDSTYRAALEVSRAGELSARIPYDLPMKLALPQPLPRGAPADVQSRFNKLMKIYDKLGPNGDPTDKDLEQQMLNAGDHGKVLQLTVIYTLCKGDRSAFTAGYVFRSSPFQAKGGHRRSRKSSAHATAEQGKSDSKVGKAVSSAGASLVTERQQTSSSTSGLTAAVDTVNLDLRVDTGIEFPYRHPRSDTMTSAASENSVLTTASSVSKSHSSAYASVCAYTNYGGTGTLRDLDGVRCWLPCIDSLEQRAVYDITIHAPGDMHALSCGKNIAVTPTTYKVFKHMLAARKQRGRAHTYRHPSVATAAAAAAAATAEAEDTSKKEYSAKDAWLSLLAHCYGRDDYASFDFLSDTPSPEGKTKGSTGKSPAVAPALFTFDDRVIEDDAVVLSTRFFTTNRIPAMALGFFVGRVEGYKMNLYKTLGRFWVALDLMDHYTRAHTEDNKSDKRKTQVGGLVSTFGEIRLDNAAPAHNSNSNSTNKRTKLADGSYSAESKTRDDKNSTGVPEEKSHGDSLDDADADAEEAADRLAKKFSVDLQMQLQARLHGLKTKSGRIIADSRRLLYDKTVMHTTLGLELAFKHIHKFVGHFFDHDVYTQVFVHGLDEQFCSFDGFALVDASLLHTSDNISMETPAHVAQITAYLYAWMKAALPVDSYEAEFIIHGTVGYLVNFYLEHVFGEDEGKYRYQKMRDTVIELEKAGKGMPLASLFPENYEEFSPYFRQYLTCKSTVLFHMIENTIGGKDPMRLALKQIVKSPAVYAAPAAAATQPPPPSSTKNTATASQEGATENLLGAGTIQPYTGGALAYGAMSLYPPPTPFGGSDPPTPHPQSPYISGPQSPYVGMPQSPYVGMPQSPYLGMPQSPYLGMPQSPYISSGVMSPQISSHGTPRSSSDHEYQEFHEEFMSPRSRGNSFSLPSPVLPTNVNSLVPGVGSAATGGGGPLSPVALMRQVSVTSEPGWERDLNALVCDCLSANTFIALVRSSSGASADLSTSFVDKYVLGSGVTFVRMGLTVEPKVENKPRTISVALEQAVRSNSDNKNRRGNPPREELKLRIVEFRDNVTREPTVTVGEKREIYTQQMHTRPGRRGGRRKGSGKLGKDQEGMPADQLAEMARAERERDANKDAVQMARDLEHPVRYVLLDPYCTALCQVHNFSADCLVVEQLFTEIDEFDLLRHIQALRSLACISRSSASNASSMAVFAEVTSQSAVSEGVRSDIIQLRALSDCLLGNPPSQTLAYERANSGASGTVLMTSPHTLYIRVEAAFAIAQWQNERAPRQASPDASWPGLAVLLTALKDMFIDPDTSLPLPNDFTDEASTILRTSLLLAVSTIRSQNGFTPLAVSKTLLLFAEHNIRLPSTVPQSQGTSAGGEGAAPGDVADGATAAGGPTSQTPGLVYDDSHYKAALLLALSRVKVDNHHVYGHYSTKGYKVDSSGYLLSKITAIARSFLQAELVFAKGIARTNHIPGDANLLPKLPMGGLVLSAAITCLAEVDIQATWLGLTPSALASAPRGPLPTGYGEFTGTDYSQYFLQPGMTLAHQQKQSASGAAAAGAHTPHHQPYPRERRHHRAHEKWEESFSAEARRAAATASADKTASSSASVAAAYSLAALCTPAVREAALEAFAHLCFVQYRATVERNKRAAREAPDQSADKIPLLKYTNDVVGAPLDAVLNVIKFDPSRRTRRQAALTLLHAVQERPLRCTFAAFSLGEPWLCIGWPDTDALTLSQTAGIASAVAAAKSGITQISSHPLCGRKTNADIILDAVTEVVLSRTVRSSWRALWNMIREHSCNDQVIRSVLLTTWIHTHGKKAPRTLMKQDRSNVQAPADEFFDHDDIPEDRLDLRTPLTNAFPIEQALRFGNDFKPPAAPAGAGVGSSKGAGGGSFVLSIKRQKSEAGAVRATGGAGAQTIAAPPAPTPATTFKITLK